MALGTLAFLGSSVPEGVWNYPVPGAVHVAFATLLVVVHLLSAHGLWGVSRVEGASRIVRVTAVVAAASQVLFSACEAASGTLVGVAMTSGAATAVGSAFGVTSLVYALATLIGGVAIAKRGLLPGANWSVAASGAILLFLFAPANVIGSVVLQMAALTLWSLVFVWMGRGLASAPAVPARAGA